MRRTGIVAVALALLALLVAAPGAFAGPPGKWTRITGIEGVPAANTDEVGLLRTADGVLHVAWTRPAGGLGDTVLHSAISADAKSVSGPDPILTAANNGINSSVDLVGAPGGGLRVLFAGLFPETPLDTVMASATAPEAGTPWSAPSPVSSIAPATRSPVYVAAGIGGAVSPSGETVLVWGDSGPEDGGYHLGLDPATPDVPFPVGLAVDPNATFDAAGTAYLAWIVLGGLETPGSLQVMPVGGAPVTVPKSAAAWTGQRVSISSRIGAGGVYVAYGSGSNEFDALPAWWRVGAAKPIVIKGQRDAEHTGLAPAPGGRLWIYWNRHGRLYAARTDQKAKKLGAIVSVKPPKGTERDLQPAGRGLARPPRRPRPRRSQGRPRLLPAADPARPLPRRQAEGGQGGQEADPARDRRRHPGQGRQAGPRARQEEAEEEDQRQGQGELQDPRQDQARQVHRDGHQGRLRQGPHQAPGQALTRAPGNPSHPLDLAAGPAPRRPIPPLGA